MASVMSWQTPARICSNMTPPPLLCEHAGAICGLKQRRQLCLGPSLGDGPFQTHQPPLAKSRKYCLEYLALQQQSTEALFIFSVCFRVIGAAAIRRILTRVTTQRSHSLTLN
jgi:hypothetical protein